MDPNKSLFGNVTKAASDAAKKTVKVTTEEIGKAGDQAANQMAPAPATDEEKKNTREEMEGIYGGKNAVMDVATYKKKAEEDKKTTLGLMDQILGQLLGPNHKMHDDRKERVASEHKHEAEELGQEQTNQKQEEEQKKQMDEQEEFKKKEEKKAKLEAQIEAPAGKQTGFSLKRKNNTPKMQRPPSAETRGGRGNRE